LIWLVGLVCLFAVCTWPVPRWVVAEESAAVVAKTSLYTQSIAPLLEAKCLRCHGPEKQQGALRLDQKASALKGGESGEATLVPGRADQSELYRRITATDPALAMPPGKDRLTPAEIALLKQWIDEGAHWPEAGETAAAPRLDYQFSDQERAFWAFQPLRESPLPPVWNTGWATGPIDRWLLSRLEKEGLRPSPEADRLTLLRRLRVDLTGLLPTPQELAAWQADSSPEAYARLVEHLLASPEFGERWGRHWLDITYYADTTGVGRRTPLRDAWRYRDYVIETFNTDRSIAQFVREQIAGDLLPAASEAERLRQQTGTAYLVLGPWDFSVLDKLQMQMDMVDLQIDLVGRSLLGLSIGCARCHDHKFDPIPTRDYYALAGIFRSTNILRKGGGDWDRHQRTEDISLGARDHWADELEAWEGLTTDLAQQQQAGRDQQAAIKKRIEELKAPPAAAATGTGETAAANPPALSDAQQQELRGLEQQVKEIESQVARTRRVEAHQKMLRPRLAGVYAARDLEEPADAQVNLRGNVRALGPAIPRGVLQILPVPAPGPIPAQHSGRLQLADWLVSDANPLTPRVFANRVWHHLFGVGLVPTVDNFGSRGDRPSHPELLDYLALRLVRSGWSAKSLVREIVLSRAYQQASHSHAGGLAADPGNRLLWRMNPRRLEAEAIRDAILQSTRALDRQPGGPTLPLTVENLFENAIPFIEDHSQVPEGIFHRRAVYLPVLRGSQLNALDILPLFDFADPDQVVGARTTTNVPLQTLFLLNSGFVQTESRRLAQVLLADERQTNADRIRALSLQLFSRPATAAEIEEAWEILDRLEADFGSVKPKVADPRLEAWARYIQALLVSAEFLYRG
jgi:mono/diheme cytochrome c family protein